MNRLPGLTRFVQALYASAHLRAAVLGGTLLAAMCCSAVLYLRSPFAELQYRQSEQRELTQQLAALQKQRQKLQLLLRTHTQTVAEYRSLTQSLPARVQIAQLSDTLGSAAQQYDVQLQNIAPGSLLHESFYAALPLQLEFSGAYTAVFRFVEHLRRRHGALWMRGMDLRSQAGRAEVHAQLLLQLHCCAEHPEYSSSHTATPSVPTAIAAPQNSPFHSEPGHKKLTPVGHIRHGGQYWELIRDAQGRIQRRRMSAKRTP